MSGFAEQRARLEGWLDTRAAAIVLLVLLGAAYTWTYARHPLNPGHAPVAQRVGWWSWSDQYKYLQETQAMAAGGLSAENYKYPLGYPALGAPFVRWLPAHAYFIPDLVLVLAAGAVWWRLARRWLPATVALAVAVLFSATHRDLIGLTMVVPWNTLATQLTLLAGLWVMLAASGPRAVMLLALLAALTWFVRPIDAVSFAPMLGWAVLRLPAWRQRIGWGAAGVGVIALALAVAAGVNHAVFGAWRSPYEQAAFNMVGFFDYPVAQKLFWTFVDARPFFGETDTALLGRHPWLLLAIPGIFFWVKREGAAGAAAVATLLLNWLLYLGYNDFFPSSFYRFSLIHYVSWSFLPLAAAAAGACWSGWKMPAVRLGAGLALAVFALAGGLQLEERVLPAPAVPGEVTALPAVRPLWVRFPGDPLDAVTKLQLDGRGLTEAADYQIPYVPSDLKLLLGARARGTKLGAPPGAGLGAQPVVGDYRWVWRWAPGRLVGR